MGKTITGTTTLGVTLSTSTTTIDGTIATNYTPAIYGTAAKFWTIANDGLISATNPPGKYGIEPIGIVLAGGGEVINTAGATVYGYKSGISVAGASTINNAGAIESGETGIVLGAGGAVTNSAGGVISGGFTGIESAGSLSLLNRGLIYGASTFFGAGVYATGTITNAETGTIIGASGVVNAGSISGVSFLRTGTIDLLNQGLISGTGGPAVSTYGDIDNTKTGTITGVTGIQLDGGTITNAGLIAGSRDAIDLAGGAYDDIIERTGGTIHGTIAGFIAGDTIDEAGLTITSAKFAKGELMLFDGTTKVGTLTLTGDLNSGAFVLQPDGSGGTDIALGTETFTGTYESTVELAALSNTIAAAARLNDDLNTIDYAVRASAYRYWTLANLGKIDGYHAGVDFAGAGQITNAGLIQGATGIISAGQIMNNGEIKGGIGINFAGGTIFNAGNITGTSGSAIDLAFNTATTDIILAAGSTLHGAIAGFETGDTIDLAAITATGAKYAGGILTLTDGGLVVDTIALHGAFKTSDFKLGAAPGGGTDITIAATELISGHYTTAITLSALFTSISSKASIGGNAGAYALYAPPGRDWTVVNSGTINASGRAVGFGSGQFTNTSSGVIAGADGFYELGGLVSLTNAGTISGDGPDGTGVALQGGSVTNVKSGTISGGKRGVYVAGGTVTNHGVISGPSALYAEKAAVYNAGLLIGTGSYSNAFYTYRDTGLNLQYSHAASANGANGTITGAIAVRINNSDFSNAGKIEGLAGLSSIDSAGMIINGGVVTNESGGIISGAYGALLTDGGTLINAGTITSTLGQAGIALYIEPAAYTGGSTLVLDQGNIIHGAISGLSAGDVLDFAAATITSDKFSNGILTVRDGANIVERLSLTGDLKQADFTLVPEGALGTEIVIGPQTASGSHDSAVINKSLIATVAVTSATNAAFTAAGTEVAIAESAAAAITGAVITRGVLSSLPMRFLRAGGAGMDDQAAILPGVSKTAASPSGAPAAAPMLAGWLGLNPATPVLPPAITLHAG